MRRSSLPAAADAAAPAGDGGGAVSEEARHPGGGEPAAAAPPDAFYRGTILRVQYGRGEGVLRTGSGRQVLFSAAFVNFLGGRSIRDLTEGMEVGFDVGWTARGLRVTTIKID